MLDAIIWFFFAFILNLWDVFKGCVYSGAPQVHGNVETLNDVKKNWSMKYFKYRLVRVLNNFSFVYKENMSLKGDLISYS